MYLFSGKPSYNMNANTRLLLITQQVLIHEWTDLQKHETVSSMSSGSACGTGAGAGDGGTLRYLTCSMRRAARAPLLRRMPTGQRRPELSSPSAPPPPSLILRTHAFTTMHDTLHCTRNTHTKLPLRLPRRGRCYVPTREERGTKKSVAKKRRSRLRAAADWRRRREGREDAPAARVVTSRVISTPVCAPRATRPCLQAPSSRKHKHAPTAMLW